MSEGHTRSENFPWTIAIVDHPPRSESPGYRASRRLMNTLAATVSDWAFGQGPFEDHHGGGVWVKDDKGWLCFTLPLGVEWSAQFCADPVKIDRIRQFAARVVDAFPDTLPGYVETGYDDGERLLTTAITTADDVGEWTDSIFNASVPLPRGAHSGVLPQGAGYHHYPKPIVDIDHFRYDDFQLFVSDDEGYPAVVVPIAPRGSGDSRVRLIGANPGSSYAQRLLDNTETGAADDPSLADADGSLFPDILDADDPLARQAFALQQ